MMSNASSLSWVPWVRVQLRLALIAVCTLVCTLSGVGCSVSDTGPAPERSVDQFFAVFALEHHAINLSMIAPYDTVTLHIARTMGDGSAVPGEVTYSVSDSSISITDGVLTAVSPVARALVRVTLTYGAVTRTDSAMVSVIADAPDPLQDFGLRVPAGDSAKTATNSPKTIPLLRASASGATLSTLLVSMASSDSAVVSPTQSGDSVNITARRPGRVVLVSSTFAFGTVWRDSLVFTVGWPLVSYAPVIERAQTGSVATVLDFGYRDVTIGVGGCVVWQNKNSTDIDLQFDDPSHIVGPGGSVCPVFAQVLNPDIGGNIEPFHQIPLAEDQSNFFEWFVSGSRARVFSAPGVFPYRSTLNGTSGRVRVCDERNDTTCAPVRMGGWY